MEHDVRQAGGGPPGGCPRPAPWAPRPEGLLRGQIVDVLDPPAGPGGGLAQFLGLEPEPASGLGAQLLDSGECVSVPPGAIRTPLAPELAEAYPADGAGYGPGFDVVLGPGSEPEAAAAELAEHLAERGFCVVRRLHGMGEVPGVVDAVRRAETAGWFSRLPDDVEEGHLGRSGRARVLWLDHEEWLEAFAADVGALGLVQTVDAGMTGLACLARPFCADELGREVTERSPALICLSMSDAAEDQYEAAPATDEELSDFYATWRRTVLRVVHFLDPDGGSVVLRSRGGDEEYCVPVQPNTILVLRPDTLEYSFVDSHGEACWAQCLLMTASQTYVIEGPLPGLEFLEADMQGPPAPSQETVAVVAAAIQAAGGMTNHHEEWAAYMAGVDGQLHIPVARFDYGPYYSEEFDNPMGTTYVMHNGMQEGIEFFDNKIFEISHMEATAMDPQCRQVLEVGCSILYHKGILKRWCNTHPTHASVSVGCDKEEWLNMAEAPVSVATNNQLAISANRFNYVFNLKGGSYVTDTACSSSLVATHLGKMILMEQRWDPLEYHLALGTNLTLTVKLMIGSCMSHMLSPGGRCFTFNATANGYNRGDGTAGMMLKLGDRPDERWAFLRGTQIGQDGRSASLSAPNGPAQEKCIWGAIREARMRPPESTVWECHGTGTSLGDPIEVGAVRKVQIREPRQEPLMVSTSKSNIGHLEGSAAMVAMCKCIMVVIRTKCAPTQHFHTLNPHLEHAKFDAIFCGEANPYKYRQGHCQVSSFGVGGTNGHAVFWGESPNEVDHAKIFLRAIRKRPPAVIMDGPDPQAWEFDKMEFDADDGAERYLVTLEKDVVTSQITVKYESAPELRPPSFYCIVGNHNGWTDDRMAEGEVAGLFYAYVEVPESGALDFRFWAEGQANQALGPSVEACASCAAEVVGPTDGLDTYWRARSAPGSLLRVELLAPSRGLRAVTWLLED